MKNPEQTENYQYYTDVTSKATRRREHDRIRKGRYPGWLKVFTRRTLRHMAKRNPEDALTRMPFRGWEF